MIAIIRKSGLLAALGCLFVSNSIDPAQAQSNQLAMIDLSRLSIEDLAELSITSVSKIPERLGEAPAAVYVITQENIRRSGATTIPEALRLAPNLHVARTSPSRYVITARGLNGNTAAQNFSNKLLVLIDGRSVYTPLYSGVYWDMQDVLMDDVDRIEVISGPGATLWGANAVNGVINITTQSSAKTQGGSVTLGAGNLERAGSIRYGGRISPDLTYRIYAKGSGSEDFKTSTGASAEDGWSRWQGGFRMDWTPERELVTLQGDIYRGSENRISGPDEKIGGGNILARWTHPLDNGSELQLQAYYDQTRRAVNNAGGAFTLHTFDVSVQHSFQLGNWNHVVWGAGNRVTGFNIKPSITPTTMLDFEPRKRTLNLANIFVENHLALGDKLELTLGAKLEDQPYAGLGFMPSARLSWKVNNNTLLWAAASRALRSPTPFDTDVVEVLGGVRFLLGDPNFRQEKLTAYEIGYRGQLSPQFSLSISTFLHVYDDLRSIEITPVTFIPLSWGNMIKGNIYGVESWATWQVADWWQLKAGLVLQEDKLKFKRGASGLLGISQVGNDPHHRAMLQSSMALGEDVTLDADLRHVGHLPDPHVPAYAELNMRVGWMVNDGIELSLTGYNLLHGHHQEFTNPESDRIGRSFFIETRWKF